MLDFLSPDQIHQYAQQFPESWPVALGLLLLFAAGGCLFFPIPLMAFVATLIFPLWKALIISVIGSALASMTAYWLGYFIKPEKRFEKYKDKIQTVKDKLNEHEGWAVFALRIAPTPPFTFTSVVSGSLKIPFLKYLLASVLGIGPLVVLVCIWGREFLSFLKEPSSMMGAALVAFLILYFVFSSGKFNITSYFFSNENKKT